MTGKVARLIAEFVATVHEHGGSIDARSASLELRDRIEAMSTRLGMTVEGVLHGRISDDWGRQVARAVVAELRRRDAAVYHGGPVYLHLQVAAEHAAALTLAMLDTVSHHEPASRPMPVLDLRRAADAVACLGTALRNLPCEGGLVAVDAQIAAWTRAAIATEAAQAPGGARAVCPCQMRQDRPDAGASAAGGDSESALPSVWRIASPVRRTSVPTPR